MLNKKQYQWEDIDYYIINRAWYSGDLSVKLVIKDGLKIELFPSCQISTDAFDEKVGDYAVYVNEILKNKGVEKQIKNEDKVRKSVADYNESCIEAVEQLLQ